MTCFYPLAATQFPNGEITIWKRTPGIHQASTPRELGKDLKLPCGRCIGCKLDRSKEWSIRLMHEAQLHEKTSFVTLTYNNAALYNGAASQSTAAPARPLVNQEQNPEAQTSPKGLIKRDLQLFMKRLRESSSQRIKFYACGEYGEKLGRPHYHIALFGEDFSDDRWIWRTNGDTKIYRSSKLEKIWTYGNSEIGSLTKDSAAYIAAYCTKKITGPMADEHYKRVNPLTGETYWLSPEFSLMSRRPGLGRAWWDKFHDDLYEDYVVNKNTKLKPPRYYDKLLKQKDETHSVLVKYKRELGARTLAADNTPARLADKEIVTRAKLSLKTRTYEK